MPCGIRGVSFSAGQKLSGNYYRAIMECGYHRIRYDYEIRKQSIIMITKYGNQRIWLDKKYGNQRIRLNKEYGNQRIDISIQDKYDYGIWKPKDKA
jgi:hypothetical protein